MVNLERLGWYVRRLRGMSASEVAFRTLDVARQRAWARRQVQLGDALPPLTRVTPVRAFLSPVGLDRESVDKGAAAAVVTAADKVLAGTWTSLGTHRADSADPDWFHDPLTGRRAPDRKLAFRVNHRDDAETGNVKQVWEMSRHHHITVLAAAWWLTRDERYAENAAHQLRSWWAANPFLSGVHWTSGIEAGIRLISWVWVRRLLNEWPKVGDLFEHNDDAVRQIGLHQEFLVAFPSRGSSANNHVIAEAAGRLAAACAFPWYTRTPRWRASAADLLERELAANTFSDGLNRELATDYHRFVLELALLAAVEADACGHELSKAMWARLGKMLDAGADILDVKGRAPRQGDGDEGRALVVDDPDRDPWATALGMGAALVGPSDWWPAFEPSVQAVIVGALGRPRQLSRPTARPQQYPDAGMVILRSRDVDGPEIWCRCDAGPHGFLSIAAHAHADTLSLEVRHDGVDILADPGTYCYHGEAQWRQYFRSTRAHNTLELAGVDQAESGGPFLWTTHPWTTTTRCDVGSDPVQAWSGWHDGYTRLNPPARHERAVTLDSQARTLTVADRVQSAGGLNLRLSWHLGPEVSVDLCGRVAELAWRTGDGIQHGRLLLPDALVWTAHRGEESPPKGWYSPGFGRRVPSTSLTGAGAASSGTQLVTVLQVP